MRNLVKNTYRTKFFSRLNIPSTTKRMLAMPKLLLGKFVPKNELFVANFAS